MSVANATQQNRNSRNSQLNIQKKYPVGGPFLANLQTSMPKEATLWGNYSSHPSPSSRGANSVPAQLGRANSVPAQPQQVRNSNRAAELLQGVHGSMPLPPIPLPRLTSSDTSTATAASKQSAASVNIRGLGKRKLRVGPRGGVFIVVNGRKVYLSPKDVKKLTR